MIAPATSYLTSGTEALPDLRDLLSLDPMMIHASSEALSECLGLDPWVVEAALEALTVDGEVQA